MARTSDAFELGQQSAPAHPPTPLTVELSFLPAGAKRVGGTTHRPSSVFVTPPSMATLCQPTLHRHSAPPTPQMITDITHRGPTQGGAGRGRRTRRLHRAA
jgi:hypothetical protein